MDKEVKIVGIIGVITALIVVVIFRRDMPEVWGPLLTILAILLGAPVAARMIQARRAAGKSIVPGLLLTWAEWHCIVMGLGDGLAFNKSDMPSGLYDYPLDDYRSILIKEAWYYKISMGVGRLLWIPAIYFTVVAIIGKIGLIL